jgi:D-alanine--poly(phosphoribitol) ligase subunit 2
VREEIIRILEEIMMDGPDDVGSCETLIDQGFLDSMDIVTLVMDLNNSFDVAITVNDLLPENFNSVAAIEKLIRKIQ